MELFPTWSVTHFPLGGGRAQRARACSLGPPHTPAAGLFTVVGCQRLRRAIKCRKRGGVFGRRAGPRSFPTVIRISQGFASRS